MHKFNKYNYCPCVCWDKNITFKSSKPAKCIMIFNKFVGRNISLHYIFFRITNSATSTTIFHLFAGKKILKSKISMPITSTMIFHRFAGKIILLYNVFCISANSTVSASVLHMFAWRKISKFLSGRKSFNIHHFL